MTDPITASDIIAGDKVAADKEARAVAEFEATVLECCAPVLDAINDKLTIVPMPEPSEETLELRKMVEEMELTIVRQFMINKDNNNA